MIKEKGLLTFNPELFKLTEMTIAGALLLGYKHAKENIIKNTEHNFADSEKLTTRAITELEPIPFEEAIDFLKGKVPMTKDEWLDLEPKLRFRAFTVARLAECDYIEAVRGRIIAALEKGEGFAESWNDIKAIAEDSGSSFTPWYWETVYRTNTQTAYNAGRLMQYQNNPPPAWELLFIEDGRTSDICKGIAALVGNGKALATSHPFWSTYGYPPYHFNCRTTFRAVYDYEIGHGTEIENIPMKKIRKEFKPQKGFGGNPIEKESWWKITPKMIERANRYGLKEDVEKMAHNLGMKNYDIKLASHTIKKRQLGKTKFNANILNGAEPKQHEIEVAKILKDNGYDVLFTPEKKFIEGIKNPEGLLIGENKIIEMKRITSTKIDKISDRIKAAKKQNAEISIIHLDGKMPYSKEAAINEAKKALIEPANNLKEVWIIYNGKISRIKK